jgi:hypothetical protein
MLQATRADGTMARMVIARMVYPTSRSLQRTRKIVQVAKPMRTTQSSVSNAGLPGGGLSPLSGGFGSFDIQHFEIKMDLKPV